MKDDQKMKERWQKYDGKMTERCQEDDRKILSGVLIIKA